VRADNGLGAGCAAVLAGVLGQMPQLQVLNFRGTFGLWCEGRMRLGGGRGVRVAGGYQRMSDLSLDVWMGRVCAQTTGLAIGVRQCLLGCSAKCRSCRSCILAVRLCCAVRGAYVLAGDEACGLSACV
jgi:hypothetical protein